MLSIKNHINDNKVNQLPCLCYYRDCFFLYEIFIVFPRIQHFENMSFDVIFPPDIFQIFDY